MKKLAGNAAYAYLHRVHVPTSTRTEAEQGDSDEDEDAGTALIRMVKGAGKKLKRKLKNSVWDVSINSIASVTVTSGGAGYVDPPNIQIGAPGRVVVGTAVNSTATATVRDGAVNNIQVDTPGSGYTAAPAITITAANGGQNAAATALLGQIGSLLKINVTATGDGYAVAPTVNIIGGGGKDATAIAVTANQIVTRILLTNAGSGYTSIPDVEIVAAVGHAGIVASAVADVNEETDLGKALADTFSNFKEWSVSDVAIPSMAPPENVKVLLTNKFNQMDVENRLPELPVTLTFDESIQMTSYGMAYLVVIRGVSWYFKPVYPVQVQYANTNSSLQENVGDCVYANFGVATLCFKLGQKHAITGMMQGLLGNAAAVVDRILNLFGDADSSDDDDGDNDGYV
jgi:hypothetical protein